MKTMLQSMVISAFDLVSVFQAGPSVSHSLVVNIHCYEIPTYIFLTFERVRSYSLFNDNIEPKRASQLHSSSELNFTAIFAFLRAI